MVQNGHYLRLYVEGAAIAKATECSVQMQTATRELAHKDTAGAGGGFKEVAGGQKSWSVSSSALLAFGDNLGSLHTAWKDGAEVAVSFNASSDPDVTNGKSFAGVGIITSLEVNAPNNENSTYSVSIEGSGELTYG